VNATVLPVADVEGPGSTREEAVSLLQALGEPDAVALGEWLARAAHDGWPRSGPAPDWASWVVAQNVGPYAFHRLQQAGAVGSLSQGERATLQTAHYQAIAANAVQRRELASVLEALASAGADAVLLKGTALAYTVYEEPSLRLKGDIDAWIQADRMAAAVTALEALGYRSTEKAERPPALVSLVGGERQMASGLPGTGLVELQGPAFRGEWVRRTTEIDQAALWRRCVPVTIEGHPARAMAPEDALIHLCHHQAISHQFSFPWVRGLLDLHLIVQRAGPDWQEVVVRAASWRLATVVWTVMGLARQLFNTPVPDAVLGSLAPAPWRRRAIGRLRLEQMLIEMKPGGYRRRRFLIQLLLIDRGRDAARMMWRGLFPEEQWLRARYGVDTPSSLWRARLLHPWRLVTAGRA
jgi:hypothetical protein